MNSHRIRVLIADDQEVVREALIELLGQDAGLEVVGVAVDASEAVRLAEDLRPDVALVDVRMPGGGVAAAEGIRGQAPGTSVLALSAHADRDSVFSMLQAGASGYLVKGAPGREILSGVHQAARANSVLSTEVTRDVIGGLTEKLRAERSAEMTLNQRRERLMDAVASGEPGIVFQPIMDLRSRQTRGFEALARFGLEPRRPPDEWFREADELGMLTEMEMTAIRRAVSASEDLQEGAYLAFNISPATLLTGAVASVDLGPRAHLVEITEHAIVPDYADLAAALKPLRAMGMNLAVDDAGAGYASLRHIVRLAPDVIKLDISLTHGIDADPALQAMAAAFIAFAERTHSTIVAEGIETEAELETLLDLGVQMGQGYLLGKPAAAAA